MWQHDNRREQEGLRLNVYVSQHDKRSSFLFDTSILSWKGTSCQLLNADKYWSRLTELFQSSHWYWYYPTLWLHKFNIKDLGNILCGALGSDSSGKRHCFQVFQMVSSDVLSTIVPNWLFSNKTIQKIITKIKTGSWLNNPIPSEGQWGEGTLLEKFQQAQRQTRQQILRTLLDLRNPVDTQV